MAAVPDVDEALGIDDEIADEAERLVPRCLAPAPFDAVAALPERDDEMLSGHSCLPPRRRAARAVCPYGYRTDPPPSSAPAQLSLSRSARACYAPAPSPDPRSARRRRQRRATAASPAAGGLLEIAVEMHPPQIERRKNPGPPGPERPQAPLPLRIPVATGRRRRKVLHARKPLNGHLNRPRDRRCAAMPRHPHGRATAPCHAFHPVEHAGRRHANRLALQLDHAGFDVIELEPFRRGARGCPE